ncbi:Aminopeptidase S [Salinivirga cyanobacteriivorans]|uniref:Aminopeptidase S n=1 Tax=Salinivirga cyanobacteriivorans TaxID=1307839 RepID=A0A0S2HZK9_9BACT|nr:M28 family metallopeptidase [Salinivirga cyanobacteriivorans]ALO15437.1 Aminopeptidase S [Salinivirga cyanobacteriivorans]
MKKLYLSLLFFSAVLLSQNTSAQNQNIPVLDSIVEEVNQDSLTSYIEALQNLKTRYALADNRKEVAQWIQNKFISFGYNDVVLDSFNINEYGEETVQYNVICRGNNPENSKDYVLLGAHHDAITYVNPADSAPGADDNASGTAAVLEVARALKMHGTATKIPFHFATWAAEELGLHGSEIYVARHKAMDSLPLFYFNLDMIANNVADNLLMNYQADAELRSLVEITDNYTEIIPTPESSGGGSDHLPFKNENVPIIYFSEYHFSDVYHSEADILANLEMDYATQIVKGVATSFYYGANAQPQLNIEAVVNGGNGTDFIVNWTPQNNIAYYKVDVYAQDSLLKSINTDFDSLYIDDLPLNETICFDLYSIGSDSIPGLKTSACIDLSAVPDAPIASSEMELQQITLNWSNSLPIDAQTMHIERKPDGGSTYSLVSETDPANGTYSISDHPLGIWTYKFTLEDNEGLISDSTLIKVYSTDSENDIMVVIGNMGGYGNPSLGQVMSFYDSIMPEGNHFVFSSLADEAYLPILSNMGTLIWNSFWTNNSDFYENLDLIQKFLSEGGQLLVFANEIYKHTDPGFTGEEIYAPGQLIYEMGVSEIIPNNDARLRQMRHTQGLLIDVNASKLPDSYEGAVPNIEALVPTTSSEVVLTYHSLTDQPPTNSLDGEAIAVKSAIDSALIIACNVPLYYFNTSQSKTLIEQLLAEPFPNGILSKDEFENTFSIHPNPATNHFEIFNNGRISLKGDLKIYDLSGRIVKAAAINLAQGDKAVINAEEISPGVYIISISGQTHHSQKLIIR